MTGVQTCALPILFNDGASLERNTLNGIRLPAVALIDFPRALSSAADGYRVYETSGLVQPVSVSGVAGTPAVRAVDSWSGEAPHRFITVGNAIVVEGTADNRPTIIRSTNFVNMPVVSAAQNLIVTAMKDRVIGFDLTTGKQRFTTALITGKQRSTPARIERIVLSPDGKALGVVSDGGGWVLNLQGRVVRTLAVGAVGGSDSFGGRAVAFSPDATLLAFSMGNAMKVFDVATGAELVNVAVSDSASTDVAFAPDQSFVAVLSSNGFLRVFARAKLETP